jgi:hypothetical protein
LAFLWIMTTQRYCKVSNLKVQGLPPGHGAHRKPLPGARNLFQVTSKFMFIFQADIFLDFFTTATEKGQVTC